MNKITVLTRPAGSGLYENSRNFLRFCKRLFGGQGLDWAVVKYGGHTGVSRSLVEGLEKAKADFNFNPSKISEVAPTVVVLSNVAALRQAITLKKQGQVKMILAGPNIMELPNDHGGILESPEIDVVLVPSQAVVEIYEKFSPVIKGKLKVWYAGVDEEYWKPQNLRNKTKDVLLYWKNPPRMLGVYTERMLKKYGYNPQVVNFGNYSQGQFKKILNQSLFAVFLSVTETQGMALAESWSMNVPTMVWDTKMEHYYIRNLVTTAAPYLTPQTGLPWKEISELETILQSFPKELEKFQPRQWLMENMTDIRSAELLLKLLE